MQITMDLLEKIGQALVNKLEQDAAANRLRGEGVVLFYENIYKEVERAKKEAADAAGSQLDSPQGAEAQTSQAN